ncbi:MAG TPA: DUF433 domain-containing protein [Rhizomicrobium sp.]|nr:DUF433 domain-containing protein [Rhizomicrobium sp.]
MKESAECASLSIMRFERITIDPNQMGGVPCIRRLRIPVATVVGMVADGMTEGEILSAYPGFRAEDIAEALQFARNKDDISGVSRRP